MEKSPNNLINERSPYLLQHAYNPVHWHAWTSEAFELAKKENKPVFLSIGYSACHWCHVMEHESFEDKEVAKLMNDTFVSIKVDREERPDLDHIYMAICQLLTGSGGWPLTVILTPDKMPFFAGTYFPKYSTGGRVGMIDLITRLKHIWLEGQADLEKSALEVTDYLNNMTKGTPMISVLDDSIFKKAFQDLLFKFDRENGGFGNAPKFPTVQNLLFLCRYYKKTNDQTALEIVEHTLKKMSMGGIFDHVGFGFHRYSTDQSWTVPHFEKMLYDQAMLTVAFLEVFQITHQDYYACIAKKIISYVLRDIVSPEGGFYCAEDADSEGEEGKYYLWKESEIKEILNTNADKLIEMFNLKKEGNYYEESTRQKNGFNILYLTEPVSESESKIPGISELTEKLLRKLFEYRKMRVRPGKDDKILADWNGLIIYALARAGLILRDDTCIKAAAYGIKFIQNNLENPSGGLLHRYCNGHAGIAGCLDDYAFLILALTELYKATFDNSYIEYAVKMQNYLLENFWDENYGGFYFASCAADDLIVRKKEFYDGAIPSGNSIELINLINLWQHTGNIQYRTFADKLVNAYSREVKEIPVAFTMFLSGLYLYLGPTQEIIISGKLNPHEMERLMGAMVKNYIPDVTIIFKESNDTRYPQINDRPTFYICKNFQCNKPTNDLNEVIKELNIVK